VTTKSYELKDAEEWFSKAEVFLSCAKTLLNEKRYEIAYNFSMYVGEFVLKAILVKHNKFITREDYTHNQKELFKKIEREILQIPQETLQELGRIIDELELVETSTGVVCQQAQVGNMRYMNISINEDETKHKIELAEKLLRLVKPLI
jgi:HEPN domain-containing protein